MVQRSVSKRHEFREGRLTGCTRSLTALLLLLPLLPLPGSAPARLASRHPSHVIEVYSRSRRSCGTSTMVEQSDSDRQRWTDEKHIIIPKVDAKSIAERLRSCNSAEAAGVMVQNKNWVQRGTLTKPPRVTVAIYRI